MKVGQLLGGSRSRRGFLSLALGAGAGNLLALLLAPIISRLFDPSNFGSFTLLLALSTLLSSVMSLRLELAVPLAKDEATSYALVHAGIAASLTLGVTISAAFFAFGPTMGRAVAHEAAGEWLWVTPLIASTMSVFAMLNAVAVRQARYRIIAARNIIMIGAGLGFQIVAGLLGYGLGGLILGYACGQTLGAGALLVGSGLTSDSARDGRRAAAIRAALSRYRRIPLLLAPAGVINSLGLQAPVVLLALYYSADDVGWFGLTQRVLAAPVTLLGLSVAQVYLSEVARSRREGDDDPRDYFWKATRALSSTGVAIALVLLLSGPTMFSVVFGNEWRPSGDFARAMAIALAAQLIAAPLSQTLIIFERNAVQFTWDLTRVLCVTLAVSVSARAGATALQCVWVLSVALAMAYALSWELSRRTVARPSS